MCNPIPIVRSGWILRHALTNSSTSPTGSENHLASFRFQNTFLLNVWNRNGDRWFSDPVSEVLNSHSFLFFLNWQGSFVDKGNCKGIFKKLNGEVEIKPMYGMEGKESYCV